MTSNGASALGIPVSTTHTITGAIIGAGVTKRLSAVRWDVTRSIVMAWIITIPFTALLSALVFYLTTAILIGKLRSSVTSLRSFRALEACFRRIEE